MKSKIYYILFLLVLVSCKKDDLKPYDKSRIQVLTVIPPYTQVNLIATEGDHIWLVTNGGVLERDLNGSLLNKWPTDLYITDIAIDSKGDKWFEAISSEQYILLKFDGVNWTSYTPTNNSGTFRTNSDPNDRILSVPKLSFAIDSKDNIWFGTLMGLVKFDGTHWSAYPYIGNTYEERVLTIDKHDNIWYAGPLDQHLVKFNGLKMTDYNSFINVTGLMDSSVYSISVDTQGNKWLGMVNCVIKFNDTASTIYNIPDSLFPIGQYSKHPIVNVIAIDAEGIKWFGTNAGVLIFDGINWKSHTLPDSSSYSPVNSVAIDARGNKWFGTNNGVWKFDGQNWSNYRGAN